MWEKQKKSANKNQVNKTSHRKKPVKIRNLREKKDRNCKGLLGVATSNICASDQQAASKGGSYSKLYTLSALQAERNIAEKLNNF